MIFGDAEQFRITTDGNLGIGTTAPGRTLTTSSSLHAELIENKLWGDIHRAAKTNPTLQAALERVKVTYYLTEDHERRYGNRKT